MIKDRDALRREGFWYLHGLSTEDKQRLRRASRKMDTIEKEDLSEEKKQELRREANELVREAVSWD